MILVNTPTLAYRVIVWKEWVDTGRWKGSLAPMERVVKAAAGDAPDAVDWQQAQVFDAEGRISSFGEDEDGELYVLDLDGGTISRIVVTAAP